ncbi:carboxypeptidase regulatory-like domain-containing protein [Kistimonas asteriae]|uniref:carboxypeptidase regulatory-like domain-containing protein n=1 Tax=Kistimonas asteriae TaxID=517724 RepID=UPI001BAA0832|nr:carboxypeptidase regulatory-like domain-containing protein [Kistimonas asteriae]
MVKYAEFYFESCKIKYPLITILFITLLTGCAVQHTNVGTVQRIPFPIAEYQLLSKEGTAQVTGQAFLKTRGGDVKKAAGNEVMLNPVTAYSNQWYQIAYIQNTPLSEPDPQYNNYIITTTADADGKFAFNNVPAGEYYLTTQVFWEAATGYQGALQRHGGTISKKISVVKSSVQNYILTKK